MNPPRYIERTGGHVECSSIGEHVLQIRALGAERDVGADQIFCTADEPIELEPAATEQSLDIVKAKSLRLRSEAATDFVRPYRQTFFHSGQ